jgi:hypothetical protein
MKCVRWHVDDGFLAGAECLEVGAAALGALALRLRRRVNRRLRLQLRLASGGAGLARALHLFRVARRGLLHLAPELRHVVLQRRQRVGQALVLGDELGVGARESRVLDGERFVALLHSPSCSRLATGSHFFKWRTRERSMPSSSATCESSFS